LSGALSIDGLSALLFLSGVAGFGAFAWAVSGHFVGAKAPGAMKLIFVLSLIGIIDFLSNVWLTPVPDWRRAIGFCFHLLAIYLFGWAILATRRERPAIAFAGDRPTRLFNSGPYYFIRHPFYASYLLFWLGCVAETSSVLMLLIFLSLSAIYTIAALGEQSNFSNSALSDQYQAYQKSAGFFWPKFAIRRRDP